MARYYKESNESSIKQSIGIAGIMKTSSIHRMHPPPLNPASCPQRGLVRLVGGKICPPRRRRARQGSNPVLAVVGADLQAAAPTRQLDAHGAAHIPSLYSADFGWLPIAGPGRNFFTSH